MIVSYLRTLFRAAALLSSCSFSCCAFELLLFQSASGRCAFEMLLVRGNLELTRGPKENQVAATLDRFLASQPSLPSRPASPPKHSFIECSM